MGLKVDDIEKLSKIFKIYKKPKKNDPDAIKKMVGCFKDLFPEDKSSVDLIREQREEMLKQ
jgi:hypothetical protein